jgi:murein DD-endopeptidase MepM/ murein hydrolase activator NlpD
MQLSAQTPVLQPRAWRAAVACAFAAALLAAALAVAPGAAFAVTAAEKQAEADEVMAEIDALQTSLNEANAAYDAAVAQRDEAVARRNQAQALINEETARIESLEESLGKYAVSMYKQGGAASFIDVALGTSNFIDFIGSWDAITAISQRGTDLLTDYRAARTMQEEARATFEEQGRVAEEAMATAEQTAKQIEETQAALRVEVEKLTEEAAALQAEEEAKAEAARQAALAAEAYARGDISTAATIAAAAGSSIDPGSAFFCNPCPDATNSSGFGYRSFDNSFHKGLDMAAPTGTPYYAAESGTVMYATYDGGYNGGAGNWVVIAHGNGIVTKYMHSSAVYVRVGEQVTRGQNIGAVGNTGQSFGSHLHFQVEFDGVAVNPLDYI